MTAAFNLAQLANNLNTAGQLDATDGLAGAVPIANGGTGQTTANAALNAFLPNQSGNSGRVLTTNGTNTSWANTGKVLQVVTKTITAQTLMYPGSTFTDIPNYSLAITPFSTSSRILVQIMLQLSCNSNTTARLLRGSTPIAQGIQFGTVTTVSSFGDFYKSGAAFGESYNLTFVDSPSTTSATTYKLQGWTFSTSYYFYTNVTYGGTDAFYTICTPSTMTLTEIGP